MVQENIDIVVTEKGAVIVRRNIEKIGNTADKAEKSVFKLNKLLAGIGATVIIRQLTNISNVFVEMVNRLKTVSETTEEAYTSLDRLGDIAKNARAPLAEMVSVYQKASIASDELGASQEQLFQFTENVAKGIAIQGGAISLSKGALLQLGQALGSTIVKAEEFNSIQEGAFPILQAVARGYDKAGGSVAKLRNLVLAQKVTSKDFFQALLSQSEEIDKIFGRTTATIRQAWMILTDQITLYIGKADKAVGASTAIADSIKLIANNLDSVIALLGVMSGAVILASLGKLAAAFYTITGAIQAMTVALATNPLGLLAVVIATIISAMIIFKDEIITIGDTSVRVGDVLALVWDTVKEAVSGTVNAIGFLSKAISSLLAADFSGAKQAWTDYATSVNTAFANMTEDMDAFIKKTDDLNNLTFHKIPKDILDKLYGQEPSSPHKVEDAGDKLSDKQIQTLREKLSTELQRLSLSDTEFAIAQIDRQIAKFREAKLSEEDIAKFSSKAIQEIIDAESQVELENYQQLQEEKKSIRDQFSDDLRKLTTTDGEYARYQMWQRVEDARAAGTSEIEIAEYTKTRLAEIDEQYRDESLTGWAAYLDNMNKSIGTMESSLVGAFNRSADAFVAFVNGGKVSFRELAQSMVQDLQRIIFKQLILNALKSATASNPYMAAAGAIVGGAGGAGNKPGGGQYAMGGRPPVGKISMVGEKGPELFVPDTAGRIVPNHQLNQGSSDKKEESINNMKVVNVLDPSLLGDFLGSSDGEQVFINNIQRNAGTIKNILQGS